MVTGKSEICVRHFSHWPPLALKGETNLGGLIQSRPFGTCLTRLFERPEVALAQQTADSELRLWQDLGQDPASCGLHFKVCQKLKNHDFANFSQAPLQPEP